MADMGIAVTTIREAFGHSSTKVTERYVHTPPDSVRRAMDQVNAAVFGTPANSHGPERTETETETGFGLATFNEAPNVQTHGENRSRLGCAVSRVR